MEVRQLHAPRTGGTALAWALRGTRVKRCGHAKRLVDLDPTDRVVTTVRDPVDRFASTWGWLRRTGCAVRSPEELLAASRYVVGPHLDLLRSQSWWLGPPALLHRRALWIGRTEHLDEDLPHVFETVGVPTEWVNRRVAGAGNDTADLTLPGAGAPVAIRRHASLTPDLAERLRAINPLDVEIHHLAMELRSAWRERLDTRGGNAA